MDTVIRVEWLLGFPGILVTHPEIDTGFPSTLIGVVVAESQDRNGPVGETVAENETAYPSNDVSHASRLSRE